MEDHKVMLITGTRKGIGKFLSKYYVEKGFWVEGCSRKQPDWELANYYHHITDVTDEAQVKAMFSSIRERHGRLDVTISNAGIASMNQVP